MKVAKQANHCSYGNQLRTMNAKNTLVSAIGYLKVKKKEERSISNKLFYNMNIKALGLYLDLIKYYESVYYLSDSDQNYADDYSDLDPTTFFTRVVDSICTSTSFNVPVPVPNEIGKGLLIDERIFG